MKQTLGKIINNTFFMNALLILTMTQSFAFAKLFWLSGTVHDGSFGEFANTIGTVIVSIIALLVAFRLFVKDVKQIKKEPKSISTAIGLMLLYTLSLYMILTIIDEIVRNDPAQTVQNITTNSSYVYEIIFNKIFYMIDIALVLGIYATRKLYKLWNFLLTVLVYKILFMFGIYLAFVSYINIYNSLLDKTKNSYIPVAYFCETTYTKANLFLLENVECPYKNNPDKFKELAKDGSAGAYLRVMSSSEISLKEKAAIAITHYEANKQFEEKTWIENNFPSIYKDSMLKLSKDYHNNHKDVEVMIANLILSGQEDKALEKAKEITADKTNKTVYLLVKELIKSKQ